MPAGVPDPQTVLRGHRGEVQALDFNRSEQFLVSGDSLGEVRVWDLRDLRPIAIRRLHPLTGGILSLRLFRCGGRQLLGTQGRDGQTLVWACDDQMHLSEEPVRSFARDCYSFCRFSVLEADLPACSAHQPGGEEQPRQQHRQQQQQEQAAYEFLAAVLAGDEAAAASQQEPQVPDSSSEHGRTRASAAAGSIGSTGSTEPPCSAGVAIWALHPCCQASAAQPPALMAIPGSNERTAEIVCCECGAQVAEFLEEAAGKKLGMLMAVQLYCSPPQAMEAAETEAARVAANTAAASGEPTTGSPVPDVPVAMPASAAAQRSPPRVYLAAGYEDGSLVVWDAAAPAAPLAQRQLFKEPVMALAVDSACQGGACGSAEEQVAVFKVNHAAHRLSVRHTIELRKQGIADVAVRPDRRLLVTAGWDGRVRVYKYRSGRPLAILKYHSSSLTSIRFAPCTMLLATAARDGTLALWPLFQPDEDKR